MIGMESKKKIRHGRTADNILAAERKVYGQTLDAPGLSRLPISPLIAKGGPCLFAADHL